MIWCFCDFFLVGEFHKSITLRKWVVQKVMHFWFQFKLNLQVKFNHYCQCFQRGNRRNQWKYKFLNLPLSSMCLEGTSQIFESSWSANKLSSTLSLAGFCIDTTQLIREQTSFRNLKTVTLCGKKCLKYLTICNNNNSGLWIRKSSKSTRLQLMYSALRSLIWKVF